MARVSDLSGEVIERGAGATLILRFEGATRELTLDLTSEEAESLVATLRPLGEKDAAKSYSVDEVRSRYPRAYAPWSDGEEEELRRLFLAGTNKSEIALRLGRQPSAIASRLRRLGLQ